LFELPCRFKLEDQWAEPVSLTFYSALRKLNTEPSIGASHQVSFAAKQFQRRFLEITQLKFGRKLLWKILYKDWSFCPDPLTNMAAIGGFRGEDYLEINQSETRIACGGHVC
jgi:hypothetical protein